MSNYLIGRCLINITISGIKIKVHGQTIELLDV